MRTLLIVLGAVLALLILAVLVGPLLVDWNAFKPRLAAVVQEATGRQLEIEGDLSLSLLPTPTLSAEGARLANLEGGSEPTMVSLRTLEVQVALMPLVRGDLQVRSLSLVEPVILLERLADGRANWQFGALAQPPADGGAEPPEPAGDAAGRPEPTAPAPARSQPASISLDRLSVEEGTVIYRDATSGAEERVEGLNATLRADSLRGPFLLEGEGRFRGQPAAVSLSTGRLALAEAMPLTLALTLPETGAAEARFNGSLKPGDEGVLVGDLAVRGDSLLALLRAAAPDADLPGSLTQPYRLTTRLSYDPARLELAAIDFSMADSALGGTASAEFGKAPGEPTMLEAALEVSRLDLDRLLSDGGGGGQDAGAVPGQGSPTLAHGFDLPADIRGQLQLEVGTLVYRGEVVRQVLVNADLQEGRLALNQALALLPGGGNVILAGDLTAEGGQPRFVGRLEAAADNLRALLAWLGIDVAGVPSERLRRASLLASLDATPQQASITGIDFEIDTSRVTGGVAVALRERLGLGIGLSIDRINVDAYLPAEGRPSEAQERPWEPAGQEAAPADASRPVGDGGEAPPEETAEDAEPVEAGPLATVDANLDLKVGQVTYNGQSAREVTLNGVLQEGRLTLRRLTVGDLAGGAFSLSGIFTGLPDAPSVEDGSFDISVPDAGRVSRLLGQPADGLLERLGSFRASGSASGSAQGFAYNVDVTALGGSIFSSGQVSGLPERLQVTDARVEGSDLRGPALARLAGLAEDSPLGRIESLGLTSRFDYGGDKATYDTRLRLLGGELVAEGDAADFAAGLPRFDFRFAAIHDDLGIFLRRLLGESPVAPGAGKLDLRTQVSGSPLKIQLAEIQGDIGPTIEGGTVVLDLARARPLVTANLETREIDLGRLLGDGGGGGQGAAPRWSRQPLDLQALRALDAELDLTAAALRQGDLVLAPARLRGTLLDGQLVLEQLDGGFYQGRLSASARLEAGGPVPAATLALKLSEVDARDLLRAFGTERVAGRLELEADLSTRGNSEAALVGALQGEGRLGGELAVEARAEEQLGNVVLGILGQQVRELRGVTNPLNQLFSAFAGRPAALSGTVQIADGVARTGDLELAGSGARLLARGTLADLPAWAMALNGALYSAGSDQPEFEVDLQGALDEPNVRLKGAALRIAPQDGAPEAANPLEQLLREALPGARQPRQQGTDRPSDQLRIEPEAPADQPPPQDEPPAPQKPADVLRGLIEGLGKGR